MAPDCSCRIEYPDNPTVEVPRIVYCPLHAADGEMLAALEEAVLWIAHGENGWLPPRLDALWKKIKAQEVKP